MNTTLTQSIRSLLAQLEHLLEALTDEEYTGRIDLLSGATLGQHTRHIIEFFVELFIGYENGTVNYDRRKRDTRIENSRGYARQLLQGIAVFLDYVDKPLTLVAEANTDSPPIKVQTNFHRELVYNQEHAIHHMALLRIGVNVVSKAILPADFGVAMSTVKYRKTCAR